MTLTEINKLARLPKDKRPTEKSADELQRQRLSRVQVHVATLQRKLALTNKQLDSASKRKQTLAVQDTTTLNGLVTAWIAELKVIDGLLEDCRKTLN